jgi:hypothetical protein
MRSFLYLWYEVYGWGYVAPNEKWSVDMTYGSREIGEDVKETREILSCNNWPPAGVPPQCETDPYLWAYHSARIDEGFGGVRRAYVHQAVCTSVT